MTDVLANRYRIQGELGKGAMGTVYEATDLLHDGRLLALKVIHSDVAFSPEANLRFKEEFRAMVKLQHPNTVVVHDYGQIDERTRFLTMEIVPGQDLSALIPAGMPFEQIYRVLIQLLQALGFIHSRLYVHRDIKPQNLRLQPDGLLKLMDFGLMEQLGTISSGKLTGSFGYMPPEIPKGGVIAAPADLYSVGCLAYQMITGGLPFQGKPMEVVKAHVMEPPAPLRSVRADVPARLEAIVGRLLEKDPQQRYQSADEVIADLADLAGVTVVRQNLAQRKSYLISSVLVGRDGELAELQATLADVKAGQGRAVFVGAPAGIGKSRLVHELLLQAKLEDVVVLHGQCLETGAADYAPLVQALRPLLGLSTTDELQAYGPALARLLPELRQWGIAPLPPLTGGDEKLRVNQTVVAWLKAMAARMTLVLVFDDLQWSDPLSLEVLNYSIRELQDEPLLVLATFRNDEAPLGTPLWYTIDEGRTRYMTLKAFTLPQTLLLLQAMLRELRISQAFGEFLYHATSGNAFFITESLRYLVEEGILSLIEGVWHFPSSVGAIELPESVEATVRRRLKTLSPAALAVAKVASVLGRYQDVEALQAIGGIADEALYGPLDELLERQFLLKDEGRYSFPHDRVREAIYDGMDPERRRQLHRQVGAWLEQRHADDPDRYVAEMAYHFDLGEDGERAYTYLLKAGNQAKQRGEETRAFDYWLRAERHLEALDRPHKTEELLELRLAIGRGVMVWPRQVIRALELCLPVIREGGDPAQICATMAWLLAAYGAAEMPRRGALLAAEMERMIPPGATLLAVMAQAATGALYQAFGYYDGIRTTFRKGSALADSAGDDPRMGQIRMALASQLYSLAYAGIRPPVDELDAWSDFAIQARQVDYGHFAIGRTAVWYAWRGQREPAQALLERIEHSCRRFSMPEDVTVLYLKPYLLWQQGLPDEALAGLLRARRFPHAQRWWAGSLLDVLAGQIALSLGEAAECESILLPLLERARRDEIGLIHMQTLITLAELALSQGRPAQARECLVETRGLTAGGETRNPLHDGIACRLLAEVATAEGRFDEAQALLGEALATFVLPELDNQIQQAHTYRALADLLLARGQRDQACSVLQRAAELYRQIDNRHGLGRVLARLDSLQPAP